MRACVCVCVCKREILLIKQMKQGVITGIIQSADRYSFTVNPVSLGYMVSTEPAMDLRLRKTEEVRRAHEGHMNSADVKTLGSVCVCFPLSNRILTKNAPFRKVILLS